MRSRAPAGRAAAAGSRVGAVGVRVLIVKWSDHFISDTPAVRRSCGGRCKMRRRRPLGSMSRVWYTVYRSRSGWPDRPMMHSLVFLLAAAAQEPAVEHFEKKVRPVLHASCVPCHGPEKQKGGLRLDSRAGLQKGGDSGAVVVAGDPDKSLLMKAVRQTDPDLVMPPRGPRRAASSRPGSAPARPSPPTPPRP